MNTFIYFAILGCSAYIANMVGSISIVILGAAIAYIYLKTMTGDQ